MTILIPSSMRRHTGGASRVEVKASTVGQGLKKLCEQHGELRAQLFEHDNLLTGHLNVFVGTVSIRDLNGLQTTVGDQEEVLLVPALAGG